MGVLLTKTVYYLRLYGSNILLNTSETVDISKVFEPSFPIGTSQVALQAGPLSRDRLVLGILGLIDAKVINVTQPI